MKNSIHKGFSTVWSTLKMKTVWIPAILIIILFFYFSPSSGPSTEQVKIQPSTFVQQVLLTGKVVANSQVSMGFETSGRVSSVNVKVGDKVLRGQTLAAVSNGDLYASVDQKRALVDAEKAKLAEIVRGSRPEDISIAQSDVANAQVSVDQSLRALVDQLRDNYAKSDDVLRSKIDQLYNNPTSANPEIIGFNAPQGYVNLSRDLGNERILAGETLNKWNKSSDLITTTNFSDASVDEARKNLSFMRDYLNDLTIVVVSLQANSSLSATTINQYRTDISNARTIISTALSGLTSAEETYKGAIVSLQRSKDQLALKQAGSTDEQIATERAQVKSAEASLANASALLSKTLITAPFDGVITKVDIDPGEISSPNNPVIDLMGAGDYQIESFVSESDVSKIKVGQTAIVTLDAYGKDQKFEATVISVDPSETIVDGVSTYKTKFVFTNDDSRIKSGMTANLTVKTDERGGAIIIPQNAIFLLNGEKTVNVLVDGKIVSKKVATGGLDADGNLLVVSGLNEGDIIQIKSK